MKKNPSKPRGEGTYYARLYFRCSEHGLHVCTLMADDDVSWLVAGEALGIQRMREHEGDYVLRWFVSAAGNRSAGHLGPLMDEVDLDELPY